MTNHFPSHYPDIGVLGEDLVAQWLQSTGWIILHRRWRCRWGEIDIIAREARECSLPLLIFVEVKTRSRGNWDAGGILAITPQKQAKLWQTAQWFLGNYPEYVDYPCRFDAALVFCQRLSKNQNKLAETLNIQLGQAIAHSGYQLILKEYIPSAFE